MGRPPFSHRKQTRKEHFASLLDSEKRSPSKKGDALLVDTQWYGMECDLQERRIYYGKLQHNGCGNGDQ
jgi:hypothetical protein